MLKERRAAVETVTAAFLPTEHAAEQVAILGARCIATMIEQRRAAHLPLDTGAEALSLVSDAMFQALKLRETLVAAHVLLAALPASIGITAFGGDTCPPNTASVPAPLRSVA